MTDYQKTKSSSIDKLSASAHFEVLCLLILRKYYKYKPRIHFAETTLSEDEVEAALEFKDNMLNLIELVQKISDDKNDLSWSIFDSVLNDTTLKQISNGYKSILHDCIDRDVKQAYETMDENIVFSQQSLEDLRNELREVKDDMSRTWEASSKLESRKKSRESLTQMGCKKLETEDDTLTTDIQIYENENVKTILLAVKTCMDKIIDESRSNWKTPMLEMFSFWQQNNNEMKSLLTSYSEGNELTTTGKESNAVPFVSKAEELEKQLFEVFLLLDRHLLEVQTIQKTLKFFDRKFVHFAEKCSIHWEENCSKHENISESLHDSQARILSVSSRFLKTFGKLSSQSEKIGIILDGISSAIECNNEMARIAASEGTVRAILNQVDDTSKTIESRVCDLKEGYISGLNHVSEALKQSGAKLNTVFRYTERLEILNALADGNAEITVKNFNDGSGADQQEVGLEVVVNTESESEHDPSKDEDVESQCSSVQQVHLGAEVPTQDSTNSSCEEVMLMLNNAIKETASKLTANVDKLQSPNQEVLRVISWGKRSVEKYLELSLPLKGICVDAHLLSSICIRRL